MVILQIILNVLVCNILFMNLNRSYEGNKTGTIFVAEKLELKARIIGIFLRIQEYFNNARII